MAELKADLENMKTGISSSRLSGVERCSAFEDNSKCNGADMQSSEGGASTQPTSVKSEISVETHLPVRNGSHESHNAAESSCSNSLPVVLPVSFSNQSYQETCKEAHLLRNCGSSMDSFNERSPEEPVTASSVGKSCVSYDNLDSLNCTKTAESTHCRERTNEIPREVEKDKFVAGFDLNEDINTNTLDDCIQPVGETVSSHNVIRVVAKAAIPNGHPRFPLKFEGRLGWKGSAETSAFRPAKNSDRKTRSNNLVPKDELCSTGFDLNVALIDDNEALQNPHSTKSLLIDLNCLYDASDELTPPKSENRVDINSNSLTSVAEKSHQGNKLSDTCYPARQDLEFASRDYFNTTRHLGPNFIQPKHPIMLPPHGYSYKDPFPFGAGSMPYARFYGSAPHLQQVVHEQNTSRIPSPIPNFFNVKTEDSSSINESKMERSRQFTFLPKSSPMGQQMQHQEAWHAASMKRKEPEGGLESYQLGYKHLL